MNTSHEPWLLRFASTQRNNNNNSNNNSNENIKLRVFCFPFAGGGATVFHRVARAAPSGVEVIGIQLPGRQTRIGEQPLTRMETLIDELLPILLPYFALKPYVLIGHSLGGIIVFELMRSIRKRFGAETHLLPQHVFLNACHPPSSSEPSSPQMHLLNDDDFLQEMKIRYRLNIPANEPQFRAIILPPSRADIELLETYKLEWNSSVDFPFLVPATGYAATKDHLVSASRVKKWNQFYEFFELKEINGEHLFLDSEDYLKNITQDLQKIMTQL